MYGKGALTNGFEDEDVPERVSCRLNRELPLGVTKGPGKLRPFVTQCNSRYIGAFSTTDEAHDAYVQAKIADEQKRVAEINALPIVRNDEGVAVINMYDREGTIKAQALVDDKAWHNLMLSRWYFDGEYATTKINQIRVRMHQFLMKSVWIDHRNNNKLDNRDTNMRKITRSGNSQNTTRTGQIPHLQGVSLSRCGSRYEAAITCHGIQYYLGSFSSEMAAAAAYNEKAKELFDDPKLNDIDPEALDADDTNVKVRKGTSKFRGVKLTGGRWTAEAQKNKVKYTSHGWLSEEEAGLAYNFLSADLFKNFRPNAITVDEAYSARMQAIDAYLEGRGIRKKGKKFCAHIIKDKKEHNLGSFSNHANAQAAYRAKWFELYYEDYDEHLHGWSLEEQRKSVIRT